MSLVAHDEACASVKASRAVLAVTSLLAVALLLWATQVPWGSTGDAVTTVAGSLASIVAVGVAVWAHLGSRGSAHRGRIGAADGDGDELLRLVADMSRSSVSAQLEKLTNRGTLVVPWHLVNGVAGPLRRSRRYDERHGIKALAEVLDANASRLLIVGNSDSGKTTTLYRLAAMMLRAPTTTTTPIPVVIPLASWRPVKSGLRVWMAQQLVGGSPRIGALRGVDELLGLLESGRVMPFLDGFDEISASSREDACEALRSASRDFPIVITSRYVGADGTRVPPLSVEGAVVALDPLPIREVEKYLSASEPVGGEHAWKPAMAVIRKEAGASGLGDSLSSPLMAWLVGTVYAQGLGGRQDMSDLTDRSRFQHRADVEDHLLKSLVPAVFRREALVGDKSGARPFDHTLADHWLSFLATAVRGDEGRIAIWTLTQAAPVHRIALALAVLFGTATGLLHEWSPLCTLSLLAGHALGILFGFGFGRGYSTTRAGGFRDPHRFGFGGREPGTDLDLRAHLGRLVFGIATTLVVVTSAIGTIRLRQGAWPTLPNDLDTVDVRWSAIVAVAFTLLASSVGGAVAAIVLHSSAKLEAGTGAQAHTPVQLVTNDRRTGIGMMVLSWLFISAVMASALWLSSERNAVFGLLAGLSAAPGATAMFNIWINYKTAHLWLVATNRLPWHLTEFLDQAHRNGVLRQSGISYEFRHARLRQTLADSFGTTRHRGRP